MRLIGREKLVALRKKDRDTGKWVLIWVVELQNAHWKRPADVAAQFPRVRHQNDGTFLFPVPQQQIGIHVLMTFAQGLALILAVKELNALHAS